jgi:hypothetical protein
VGAVTYFVRMVAEQGNRLWVHRSTDNPNEFWLYETWADEAAVAASATARCPRPPEATRPDRPDLPYNHSWTFVIAKAGVGFEPQRSWPCSLLQRHLLSG